MIQKQIRMSLFIADFIYNAEIKAVEKSIINFLGLDFLQIDILFLSQYWQFQ